MTPEGRIELLKEDGLDIITSDASETRWAPSSLELATIHKIYREASNESLMALREYVNWELRRRGTPVKVALCQYDTYYHGYRVPFKERCGELRVYLAAIKPVIEILVTKEYPRLAQEHRDKIVSFLLKAQRPIRAVTLETTESKILIDFGISVGDLMRLHEMLTTILREDGGDVPEYKKYFTFDVTDEGFLQVLEDVVKASLPLTTIAVVTINVPLGKKLLQNGDALGEYVELHDI